MAWNELLKILNETGFYVDNQIKDGIGFYIEKIRIRNSDECKYGFGFGFGLHCKKRKKELSIYNDKILSELTNKGWTISGKTIYNKEYSFSIGYEKENEKETTKRKGYFVFKEYKPNAQLKLENRFGQFKKDIEKSGISKLFKDNIDKFLLSDQKQTDTPSQNQTPGKKTKEKKNSGKTAETEKVTLSIDYDYVKAVEDKFVERFNNAIKNWNISSDFKKRLRIDKEITLDNPLFQIFFAEANDPKEIDKYNKAQGRKPEHYIYKYFPQEGICGNPTSAKILIFSNNPGAGGFWDDGGEKTIDHVINMLKENFEEGHDFSGALTTNSNMGNGCFYPFLKTYIYNNNLELSTKYWRNHLIHAKPNKDSTFLLDYELGSKDRETILKGHKENIMTLERFSYHTLNFDQKVMEGCFNNHITGLKGKIINIITEAMKEDKILVFARGFKSKGHSWQKFLGEETVGKIMEYDHTYFTSNGNPYISSKSIINKKGEQAFGKLLDQYKKLCEK